MATIISASAYEELEARSWIELQAVFARAIAEPDVWVFRGVKDKTWALKTSLERAIEATGLPLSSANDIEGGLLRRFQREAQHYIPEQPDQKAVLEWLAIMQHYGAPTRLLDWTHSFFVATYFAISDVTLTPPSGDAAVWAMDWSWLEASAPNSKYFTSLYERDLNWQDHKNFNELRGSLPAVLKANSFNLNERVTIQQGTFLTQTDVRQSWETNLIASLPSGPTTSHLKRIVVKPEARNSILAGLYRMNIHHGTLFPGLDGFARSLQTRLVMPGMLKAHPWWK